MLPTVRAALLFFSSWLSLCAQTVNKPLRFEVASVKPASVPAGVTIDDNGKMMTHRGTGVVAPRNTGGPGTDDPGRIHYPVISLKSLLNQGWSAYAEIIGPSWLDTQVVAVDATMPAGTTEDQFREMLRSLITEGFELKYHIETKEVASYSLTVAKTRLKMKESLNQNEGATEHFTQPPKMGPDGFLIMPPRPGPWCISMQATGDRARKLCQQQTMQDLAKDLGSILSSTVTDETGLTAKYDFTLTYAGGIEAGRALNSSLPASLPDATEPLPDLFGALQSQLGLKLVPKRVSAEILVIDHMDKAPVGN